MRLAMLALMVSLNGGFLLADTCPELRPANEARNVLHNPFNQSVRPVPYAGKEPNARPSPEWSPHYMKTLGMRLLREAASLGKIKSHDVLYFTFYGLSSRNFCWQAAALPIQTGETPGLVVLSMD